jgi:hypothetical protein
MLAGMADLIVTNGDGAADLLYEAGLGTAVLPWRDVLHEGPIIPGPLEAVSEARAEYLAERFAIDRAEITATFTERDAIIRDHGRYADLALWFEHDLYDQLQLVQLLAFFEGEGRTEGLTLVQADDFLGAQTARTITRFAAGRRYITDRELAIGGAIWRALTEPTPETVAGELAAVGDALPFLRPAMRRFLEELPAPFTGLTRTEQAALEGIEHGADNPLRLFHAVFAEEAAAFMGDASFYRLLDDLATASTPLIAGMPPFRAGHDPVSMRAARLRLTLAGEAVLAGDEDRVTISGLDRWWAGTRLHGRAVWRYDREAGALVAPEGI